MKFLVILSVVLAVASADVVHSHESDYVAPIVKSNYDISPEGHFSYNYETGNGISAAVEGVVKNYESEYPAVQFTGGYRYTSPDGTPIEVTYVADETGFHPQGSHLPVAPPVPEAIAKSVEYILRNLPAASATEYKKV